MQRMEQRIVTSGLSVPWFIADRGPTVLLPRQDPSMFFLARVWTCHDHVVPVLDRAHFPSRQRAMLNRALRFAGPGTVLCKIRT